MAKIMGPGTGPQVAAEGYTRLETIISRDSTILSSYKEHDEMFVRGAAIHGYPGMFEFSRCVRLDERQAALRKKLDYMRRQVPVLLQTEERTGHVRVTPEDDPHFTLHECSSEALAIQFCQLNYLPLGAQREESGISRPRG